MTAGLARQASCARKMPRMAAKDRTSEERLAAALRENLKRRKAQARELADDKPEPLD